MRKITEIIVHCSATRLDWMAEQSIAHKTAEIRRWHKAKGWRDVGYHFLIDRDGSMADGRSMADDGAHVEGRNKNTIGICLIGGAGSNANDQPEVNYTTPQLDALRKLIESLQGMYGPVPVSGHNQFSAKACPGFNVPRWFARKAPRKFVESRAVIGQSVVGGGTVAATVTQEAERVTAVAQLSSSVSDVQAAVQPFSDYLPILRWVFIACVVAGAALTIYARWDDWEKGRQ